MFCKYCGAQIVEGGRFCMTCGQAVNASATAQNQPAQASHSLSSNPFETNSSKPRKSLPIKGLAISAGAIVSTIAVIAIFTGIANAKFINIENSPALNDSLSQAKITQIATEKCDSLALAMPTDATVQALNQRAASLAKYNAGTARKAQQILNSSTWIYGTELNDIEADLARVTSGSLDDVIAKTDTIRESDRGAFADLWAGPFLAFALDACGLTGKVDAARTAQAAFSSARTTLESYAATVPWYPDGYSEWSADSNLAMKWVEGMSCDLGDWCWHLKVTSDAGCPGGLYAEINMLDSGDNIIGFTNDTVASLGARETAILELSTYNDNVASGRLVTLNCYKY